MSGGANNRKADEIATGGEEGEVLLVDLTGEEEAETPEPFEAVQAASSWMKRPEGQAELVRIAVRGMLEGALQTLGSLEAVEQLLRERREEDAARKADEAERAAQEEQLRMDEVQFVDDSGEAFRMGGVGEATFEYVSDATSDVSVVDEAVKPARVFEANAYLAEFGRTHDDFEGHLVWMLNAVATMTIVAADGRGFARYKDRMREGDPGWVLDVGHVDL
ncbi:hypothetical protein DYB32_009220 [Aphanomyces invadans]|uniref:Uncharacterized protein n=1 Tax=Aphanomyces invadans TaxID=157072 RepID=A0A418AIY1_9STRA|nr:hypothetical protein DYB32_009220 [Aphanomyces invadans]